MVGSSSIGLHYETNMRRQTFDLDQNLWTSVGCALQLPQFCGSWFSRMFRRKHCGGSAVGRRSCPCKEPAQQKSAAPAIPCLRTFAGHGRQSPSGQHLARSVWHELYAAFTISARCLPGFHVALASSSPFLAFAKVILRRGYRGRNRYRDSGPGQECEAQAGKGVTCRECDTFIVGAGSAGSVLANSLKLDPHARVLCA